MKRPDETSCLLDHKQAGQLSGERVLMEKIVLLSREPADHEWLTTLLERVFPECTVEIVEQAAGGLDRISASAESETDAYGQKEYSSGKLEFIAALKTALL